jgi:TRAP-type C4-dicarboxylate transport system substrate-binding protein
MRVLGLVGVFQSREEATYVLTELRPTLDAEADKAGYVLLGTAGVGSVVLFSRNPITSMEELRKTKLWRWEGEEVELVHGEAMGLSAVPSSLEDAAKAYKEGRVDGFYAVPMAALAFQWFAQTRYVTDLRTGYLQGCFIISHAAFDALPPEYRAVLRSADSKLILRFDAVSDQQEGALLGGVFEKQGLEVIPVNAKFRAEFFEAARDARERLGEKLVPKALLTKVLEILADYRAEHAAK